MIQDDKLYMVLYVRKGCQQKIKKIYSGSMMHTKLDSILYSFLKLFDWVIIGLESKLINRVDSTSLAALQRFQ